MCEIKDLVVLVVDSDPIESKKTCDSLISIGVRRLICAGTYAEAITSLTNNDDIDIVLADFNLTENGIDYSPLLCSFLQKERPGVLIILTSKEYTCSIIMESWRIGATDLLHISRENEIENLMEKWLVLAKVKNITKELINGTLRK